MLIAVFITEMVILHKYVYLLLLLLIKHNSQSQSRQLMRPMWRVETMVLPVHIGIHNHAVDRLAKNRRKDIKLLDTKLSVSRGAHSHMFD